MKAKKIATFKDKYFTTIEYEYRGHKYDVNYSNGWQVCCTPAHIQHRDNQERIDKMIDDPIRTTEHAQVGLDMFWEYVNQE